MPDQTFSEELYDDKALKDAVDRMANLIKTHATKSYVDSAVEQKQGKLTFDSTPTASSTNPVTSAGIHVAIGELKENLTDLQELAETRVAAIYETASGSIASFSDGADDMPLKSCVVNMEPIQEGSGDPSLENVRPISGRTGLSVTRCRNNLCPRITMRPSHGGIDYTVTDEGIRVHGTATMPSYSWMDGMDYSSTWLKIPAGTYIFSVFDMFGTNQIDGYVVFMGWDTNGNVIPSFALHNENRTTKINFANDVGLYYGIYVKNGLTVDTVVKIQVEVGSTATDYEPYQSETVSVNWETEAGTVYGGTLDVVSWKLVVDKLLFTANTSTMDNSEDYPGWKSAGVKQHNAKNGMFINAVVNIGKAYSINVNTSNDIIYLPKQNYGNRTQTDWIALAQNVQIVYELATPIEIQLAPQEIHTLLGENNIWSDAGDISVEYPADTKMYIDQKITEAIAAAMA